MLNVLQHRAHLIKEVEGRVAGLVYDGNDRHPKRGHVVKGAEDVRRCGGIEARGGLVKEQEAGLTNQLCRQNSLQVRQR